MSAIDLGTQYAVAMTLPATFDAAGYEALTWVPIVGVQSFGATGGTNETVAVQDMTLGRTRTYRGAVTGETIPIALRKPLPGEATTGQDNLRIAATTSGHVDISIRATDTGGNIDYHTGAAMNLLRNERSSNSFQGHTLALALNYDVVTVSA